MTATSSNSVGAESAAPTLNELAERIRSANTHADQSQLANAIQVGEWLIQAKPLVARGQWEIWVKETLGMPRVTAARNMRFARNVQGLVHCQSVTEADSLLRKSKPAQTEPSKSKARKGSEGGKANHQLKAKRRKNQRPADELYYMRERVNRAASELEWYDLEGFAWSDWTQELVEDAYDDLTRLQKWTDHALSVTIAHMGDLSRQRKLHLLDQRASDPSSSQNERRTAALAAEKLRERPALAS